MSTDSFLALSYIQTLKAALGERINNPTAPSPVILGSPGQGKTDLLLSLHEFFDEADCLALYFEALHFRVLSQADFWYQLSQTLFYEFELEQPGDDRAFFLDALKGLGYQKVVLFVDQLDELYHGLGEEHGFLAQQPELVLMGSARKKERLPKTLYECFPVPQLSVDESQQLLANMVDDESNVHQILAHEPERIHNLRILSLGNPLILNYMGDVFHSGVSHSSEEDLDFLTQEWSARFKFRMDGLSPVNRRIFDIVAAHWDPVSVSHVAKKMGKSSNHMSVLLSRLEESGMLRSVSSGKRQKFYQVVERFQNMYYLWRHNYQGQEQLRLLIGFMSAFYRTEHEQEAVKGMGRMASLAPIDLAISEGESLEEVAHRLRENAVDGNGLDWSRLGYVYHLHFGELEAATEAYRRALVKDPTHAKTWYNLGLLCQTLGKFDEAESHFKSALKHDENFALAWNTLGIIHMDVLFDHGAAEMAFRRSHQMDANDPAPLSNLGDLYRDYLGDSDVAAKNYQRAILVAQDAGHVYANLAELYRREGLTQLAASTVQQAITLSPKITWCRNVFNGISGKSPQAWRIILPAVLEHLSHEQNPQDSELYPLSLKGLRYAVILNMDLENLIPENLRIYFEPLLIAVKCRRDQQMLKFLAPERQLLVKDILENIDHLLES